MKVTVILTTYNSEKFIKKTLTSIFNQQKENIDFSLEIIVVDDCSTDKTLEILKAEDKIILLQNENNSGGPNKGRNTALKKATGTYICIADHDDEWLPQKIATQLKHINESS